MKPLLLGHTSQKVADLWAIVHKKEFLLTHDFSKGFIHSVMTGTKYYHDDRVSELVTDLVRFRKLSKPKYQFLKPIR
jgi:hypothetical protein